MKSIRQSRIKLLEELQDLVLGEIITDRDLIDREVRKKNHTLKGYSKEIKAWLHDLNKEEAP